MAAISHGLRGGVECKADLVGKSGRKQYKVRGRGWGGWAILIGIFLGAQHVYGSPFFPSSDHRTHQTTTTRRRWNLGSQISNGQLTGVVACAVLRGKSSFHTVLILIIDCFDGSSWSQSVHLSSIFKMLPSVSNKSTQIVGTYFRAIENFASGSEPNRTLF